MTELQAIAPSLLERVEPNLVFYIAGVDFARRHAILHHAAANARRKDLARPTVA